MYRRRKPQDNEPDYKNIEDEFYKTNFTIPDDKITDRFRTAIETDYYIEKLPISIVSGLPVMKPDQMPQLKVIPLYSKLIAGEYEDDRAHYDRETIRNNINFFVNNLPSFKKYKRNLENLEWVIKQHRLLAVEIFEYYKDREKKAIFTICQRFNSILRIMKIAFKNKTSPLYKLISTIGIQMYEYEVENEGMNKLNTHEEKKFIIWQDVLHIQKDMESKFKRMKKDTQQAYDFGNDLLLISMYCLIPPLRNEVKFLEFTQDADAKDKDYVYIGKNLKNPTVVLKFHKDKKGHGSDLFDLMKGKFKSPHLAELLIESFTMYPRKCLFTLKKEFPHMHNQASQRALDERLVNIFYKYGVQNHITVNSLRSAFVSYKWSDPNIRYNDKQDIVKQMRSSMLCLERNYRKILNNQEPTVAPPSHISRSLDSSNDSESEKNDDDIESENDTNSSYMTANSANSAIHESQSTYSSYHPNVPSIIQSSSNKETSNSSEECKDVKIAKALTQYQRKQAQKKIYYEKNKDRLKAKAQEYAATKSAFRKSMERALSLLNNSLDYQYKIKPSTIEKYKFYYDKSLDKWRSRIMDGDEDEPDEESSSTQASSSQAS